MYERCIEKTSRVRLSVKSLLQNIFVLREDAIRRQRNCSVIAYSTSKVKGKSSVLLAARNIKYFDISYNSANI